MPDNGYIGQVKLGLPHWQKAWYNHNKEVLQSNADKSYIYQAGYMAAVRDVMKYLQENLHIQHEFEHNHYWYAGKIIGDIFDEH